MKQRSVQRQKDSGKISEHFFHFIAKNAVKKEGGNCPLIQKKCLLSLKKCPLSTKKCHPSPESNLFRPHCGFPHCFFVQTIFSLKSQTEGKAADMPCVLTFTRVCASLFMNINCTCHSLLNEGMFSLWNVRLINLVQPSKVRSIMCFLKSTLRPRRALT